MHSKHHFLKLKSCCNIPYLVYLSRSIAYQEQRGLPSYTLGARLQVMYITHRKNVVHDNLCFLLVVLISRCVLQMCCSNVLKLHLLGM